MATNGNDRYDVVIVGGGHNGLTAAAFLARAGRRVVILEAEPRVGGFATTQELIPSAAGFRSTPYAIDLFSGMIPRSVIDDLDLRSYGFRSYEADPYATFLGPDGSSIAQWRSLDRTCAELARFSRRDAERYRQFSEILCEAWNAALPYLQDHPTRPRARSVAELAWRVGRARRHMGPAARLLLSSPASVLDEWFERDEVKVILATWAAATGQVTLDTPGYGAGMAMAVLSHRWGCHRAVGGMGALTQSLARCVQAHGGEIRLSTRVQEIGVAGGRATGALLEDGSEVRAEHVIACVDPAALFDRLVPDEHLPTRTRDELRSMKVCEQNITYFTGHAALERRPTLPRHGRDAEHERVLLEAGYQMLVPSYASLQRAIDSCTRGEEPDEIPLWVSLPSARDRTLVPEGSSGESMYFMSPVSPYELQGRSWQSAKGAYFDRCLKTIDGYLAGTLDATIGTAALSPEDMTAIATKGHACHIDMALTQFGPWRPTPSLGGYATPIDGLWHASAGSHPLPSVNGWAGRTVARTVLRGPGGQTRARIARQLAPRATSSGAHASGVADAPVAGVR
jgi:beta-carotene ketolase (CrtO type)